MSSHPAPVPVPSDSPPATPPPHRPSAEARRLAGTILEVLAGLRSITDAALFLGVSTARYTQLEQRAMLAFIAGCEVRSPGPVPGQALPGEIADLVQERDRLRSELARYQALVRIAQSSFGTAAAAPPPAAAATAPTKVRGAGQRGARGATRKPRRPTVRALRLARQVGEAALPDPSPPPSTGPASPPRLPPTAEG